MHGKKRDRSGNQSSRTIIWEKGWNDAGKYDARNGKGDEGYGGETDSKTWFKIGKKIEWWKGEGGRIEEIGS